jgi:hypothetical protein
VAGARAKIEEEQQPRKPDRDLHLAFRRQHLPHRRWHHRLSGTGKSHLVEAPGHLATDQGKTVAWHTLETLAQLLSRHRADDSINKATNKLIRADLVVIDDVGLLPVSPKGVKPLGDPVAGSRAASRMWAESVYPRKVPAGFGV